MDFVIRRQSEQIDSESDENSNSDENYDYKKWEWGYLRVGFISDFSHFSWVNLGLIIYRYFQTECENLELESFYNTYVQRLQRSYLSIFFVIHTFIEITHVVVIVATQSVRNLWKNKYSFIKMILPQLGKLENKSRGLLLSG